MAVLLRKWLRIGKLPGELRAEVEATGRRRLAENAGAGAEGG